MKPKQGAPRRAVTAIVAVAACLTIAACGSSSNNNKSGSSAGSGGTTSQTNPSTTPAPGNASAFAAQRSKLRACLEAHGVTLPSRPAGARGGSGYGAGTTGQGFQPGQYGGGGGRFFRSGGVNSKFAQALKACGAKFGFGARRFGGGRFSVHYSKTTLNKFAACVKQHGYSLPAPNTSGSGPIFPRRIEGNKQFQAAAKSCESILRAAFPRFGGGAAGPGGAPPGSPPPTATNSST